MAIADASGAMKLLRALLAAALCFAARAAVRTPLRRGAAAVAQLVPPPVRDRGLNLPPTQGTTRDGAFFPGVYDYEYDPSQVSHVLRGSGFSALRLAVNIETAHNSTALLRHKAYIDAVGGRGILCMFDNSAPKGTTWPRTGRMTAKIHEAAAAWRSIHAVLARAEGERNDGFFGRPARCFDIS